MSHQAIKIDQMHCHDQSSEVVKGQSLVFALIISLRFVQILNNRVALKEVSVSGPLALSSRPPTRV
jgi:hypothetical protein